MSDLYLCFKDSEDILKFLIEQLLMGEPAKIGCYGRSLGGVFATNLAVKYQDVISFLYVDRSLGSLDSISATRFQGAYTRQLYRYFSRSWVVDSYKNFYQFKGYKVLAQDPDDQIIDQYCALNAHVAKLACDTTFRANTEDLKANDK